MCPRDDGEADAEEDEKQRCPDGGWWLPRRVEHDRGEAVVVQTDGVSAQGVELADAHKRRRKDDRRAEVTADGLKRSGCGEHGEENDSEQKGFDGRFGPGLTGTSMYSSHHGR